MIHVNLLGVQEGKRSVEQRRQLRIAYAVLGSNVAAVLLVSLSLNSIAASRSGAVAATRSRIEKLQEIARDVESEEAQRRLLEEKRRVIAELERREVGPFRILEALSEATPARLWLTEFTDKSGQVTITGLAIDDPTVAEFLSRLQQSPYFRGLELIESAQAEEGKVRVKKFVMKGPLSYSGDAPGDGNAPGGGERS